MVCDRDCFNCIYDDCIVNEATEEELTSNEANINNSLSNEDIIKADQRAYYQEHRNERNAYAKRYYWEHRDKMLQYKREYMKRPGKSERHNELRRQKRLKEKQIPDCKDA